MAVAVVGSPCTVPVVAKCHAVLWFAVKSWALSVHVLALVVLVLHQTLGVSVSCSFEPQPAGYMTLCRLSRCTDVCVVVHGPILPQLFCGAQKIDAGAQASASATDCYVTCQDVTLVCNDGASAVSSRWCVVA